MDAFFPDEKQTRRDLEALQDGPNPVRIVYTNREGRTTERSIVPLEFYESRGRQYVRAYCYLRQESRTFALRRLEICGDVEHVQDAAAFTRRRPAPADSNGIDPTFRAVLEHSAWQVTADGEIKAGASAQMRRAPTAWRENDAPTARRGTITQLPGALSVQGDAPAAAPVSLKSAADVTGGGKTCGVGQSSGGQTTAAQSGGEAGGFFSACAGFLFQCVFYGAAILLFLASPFGELFVDFDYGSFDDTPSVLPVYDFDSASGGGAGRSSGSGAGSKSSGAPQNWTYRGFELRRGSDGHVYAPSLGRYFSSGREAHFTINAQAFQSETGLYDRTLMQIYMNADSDRNGHLSWREVAEFQRNTYSGFAYQYNSTALDPADFLRQGGGDCEDFALFTCGMLRFWGWNCKVAGFYPRGGGFGHAIAMVWSSAPIKGYGYIRIDEGRQVGSTYMQAGYWIPIDYDSIGDFSSAMGDDWELWDLDDPEDLYGQYL